MISPWNQPQCYRVIDSLDETDQLRRQKLHLLSFILHPSIFLLLALVYTLSGCGHTMKENMVGARDRDAGFSEGTFAILTERLREEERSGRIVAGALSIHRGEEHVYLNVFGHEAPEKNARRVRGNSLFDVASLTKPMVAAPAAVWVIANGTDEQADTARVLLGGQSNFDDELVYTPLSMNLSGGDVFLTLDNYLGELQPGNCHRYSNSASALLGILAEDHGFGTAALTESFLHPLGARTATFTPREAVSSGRNAAGEWLRGRPYDPLADLLVRRGHIAAHSGLFASAADVSAFGGSLVAMPRVPALALLSGYLLGPPDRMEDCRTAEIAWVSPGGLRSATAPPLCP